MRLFKRKNTIKAIKIDLAKQNAAGEWEHVYVWIRKFNIQSTHNECIDKVWYFYGIEKVPTELPDWMEVIDESEVPIAKENYNAAAVTQNELRALGIGDRRKLDSTVTMERRKS